MATFGMAGLPDCEGGTVTDLTEAELLTDWHPTLWGEEIVIGGLKCPAELVPVWLRRDKEIECSHVLYLIGKQKVQSDTLEVNSRSFVVLSQRYRRWFFYRRWRVWYTEVRLQGPKTESPDDKWPWAIREPQ